MGFMMVQLGLAAFPAAILHLVGHGFYKAWAFLRAGDVPTLDPAPARLPPRRAMLVAVIGTAAVPALGLASLSTGFDPFHSPGELTLTAIVAFGIGQVWIALFRIPAPNPEAALARNTNAVVTTGAIALVACLLYQGSAIFFAPVPWLLQSPV